MLIGVKEVATLVITVKGRVLFQDRRKAKKSLRDGDVSATATDWFTGGYLRVGCLMYSRDLNRKIFKTLGENYI